MISNYTSFNENSSFELRKLSFDATVDFLGLTVYHGPKQDLLYLPKNTVSIVLVGEKVMYYSGKAMKMRSGDILFMPAGTYLFSNICWNESQFESANICIDQTFVKLPSGSNNIPLPKLSNLNNHLRLTSSFIAQKSNEKQDILSYEEAEPVIRELTKQFHFVKEDAGDQLLFKSKIHSQLLSFNSLPEFAEVCNMSLATFKRHFNVVFKESPKKWLINKRLELADFYLATQDLLVKEVCYMTGFNNLSYFIQLFRHRFGYSPGVLRK